MPNRVWQGQLQGSCSFLTAPFNDIFGIDKMMHYNGKSPGIAADPAENLHSHLELFTPSDASVSIVLTPLMFLCLSEKLKPGGWRTVQFIILARKV